MISSSSIPDLTADRIRWPIISLDFEASGLGEGSYPIEVGLAIWLRSAAPIQSWSTLIVPTEDWITSGVWKSKSAEIHKIDQSELFTGLKPAVVINAMNKLARLGAAVLCDGGKYDRYWLERLTDAADQDVGFLLGSWEVLTNHFSDAQMRRFCEFQAEYPAPHRAGPDAVLNIRAFAAGLGCFDLEEVGVMASIDSD
jgi:hypothetical protein